ncbi:hypothetical protein Nmel_011516, partial [Mimus melanotis]
QGVLGTHGTNQKDNADLQSECTCGNTALEYPASTTTLTQLGAELIQRAQEQPKSSGFSAQIKGLRVNLNTGSCVSSEYHRESVVILHLQTGPPGCKPDVPPHLRTLAMVSRFLKRLKRAV